MFEHRFRYRFMTDDFSGSLISHNAILKGIKCVSIGHVHCACVWTIKLMVCKHNSNRFIDVMLQCSFIICFLFGMKITLFWAKNNKSSNGRTSKPSTILLFSHSKWITAQIIGTILEFIFKHCRRTKIRFILRAEVVGFIYDEPYKIIVFWGDCS